MTYSYNFPRPAVTVDAVVVCTEKNSILLIKRKNHPFKGKWALPGGFVDEDEIPEKAVQRELKEETNLELKPLSMIGVFGEKGRDPRGWTISVAYYFECIEGLMSMAKSGSDSAETEWFPTSELPELAFDHKKIIAKALDGKDRSKKTQ
jgi:8-oxo-dGTP diphosphatase